MYSFPNFEPVHCSMSSSNCCFLTCIQVSQEAGQVVWYSHILKNFPQSAVIHNEAAVDVFLEYPCFCCDPTGVGNLISGSFGFSKSSLNIWEFSVHASLKPSLENFECYLASMWYESNCAVVWAFFPIALLWGWNKKLTFSSPVATAEFSKFADISSVQTGIKISGRFTNKLRYADDTTLPLQFQKVKMN